MKKTIVFLLLFLFPLCSIAFADDGYVRLEIKGTNVNLRPQPRAGGSVVAQMNTGDAFFAEKWPITCDSDGTQWYKIVLPAPGSGAIKPLCDWDKRFKANVAYVRADFATVSDLKKGDMQRIMATPLDQRDWFNGEPQGEFDVMAGAGFIPFSPRCIVKNRADIYDSPPINDNDPDVVGRYEQGTVVRMINVDSDEQLAYVVMDPNFRKSVGWVTTDDISVERFEPEDGEKNFDWWGLQISFAQSVGRNLPEIVRKWGEAEIKRNAFEFLGEYVIFTTVEQPDFQATFYEQLPSPDGTPANFLAITYLQKFSAERKDALFGGIHIGGHDKNKVTKLLGEPDDKGAGEEGESWNWHSEFNDLSVSFDGNGRVSSVSFQARSAN